jgi:prepilin-type N-terminal cleavage/methylation domain-containing protein/prepilin-type processing-associated H-X9-DG protein
MKTIRAFTFVEFLIVVAIVAVFAAVMFSGVVLPGDREKARPLACLSNLKQIGLGIYQYAQDYDGRLMPRQYTAPGGKVVSWRTEVMPYVRNGSVVFRCPSSPAAEMPTIEHDGFKRSYAVNSFSDGEGLDGPFSDHAGVPLLGSIPDPADLMTVVESTAAYNDFNPMLVPAFTHPTNRATNSGHLFFHGSGSTNIIFADGHAKALTAGLLENAITYRWTVDERPLSADERAAVTRVVEYGQ